MTIYLKYNTASQEVPLGYFVDSTDGNSEETGLTINNTDIKLWKTGATTLANKNSGGATHISNGVYYAVLDATDTNTLGSMKIFVHVSGALPVILETVVLPAMVYDSMIAGTDVLQADVTQWNGTNVATPDTAGYPKVTIKSGTGTGEISLTSGIASVNVTQWGGSAPNALVSGRVNSYVGAMGTDVVDATALAANAVDEIWDEVVDGTYTGRQSMRIQNSLSAGKTSGGGTGTITFRDLADTKNRISATIDGSGNRTAVTIDAT